MSSELDPQLPYVQVHRSSLLIAQELASGLGCSPQHALGALAGLWLKLADRRRLAGDTVTLGATEAMSYLRLAFGMDVDPALMVAAGAMESSAEGFRVRGMSRYIATERRRRAISEGRGGVAAKSTPGGPQVDFKSTSTPPQVDLKSTSTPPQVDFKSTEERVESEELRGERKEEREEAAAPPLPVEADEQAPEEGSPEVLIQGLWLATPGLPVGWRASGKKRTAAARERWRENPDRDFWAEVFARVAKSKFCRGENERGWKVDPDWILKPDSATKVLEGKYDDGPEKKRDVTKGVARASEQDWSDPSGGWDKIMEVAK